MTQSPELPWNQFTETTTTRKVTLSTDDIESILSTALKLKGDRIDFDWRIGQWVELVISATETTTS